MNDTDVLELLDWGRRFNGWFCARLGINMFNNLPRLSPGGRLRKHRRLRLDGFELWSGCR
jgi:hypothetical protein